MSIAKCLGLWSAAVLVAVMLGGVSAETEMQEELDFDQISKDEIQELLRSVTQLFETFNDTVEFDPNGCRCGGLRCSCCIRIRMRRLRINKNCCVSVAYLRRNIGIIVTVTIGSRTIFSKEISARNPPPICAGIPYLKRGASICLQFYNLSVGRRRFCGCERILVRFLGITLFKIRAGCFRLRFLDQPNVLETDLERNVLETGLEPNVLEMGLEPNVLETDLEPKVMETYNPSMDFPHFEEDNFDFVTGFQQILGADED